MPRQNTTSDGSPAPSSRRRRGVSSSGSEVMLTIAALCVTTLVLNRGSDLGPGLRRWQSPLPAPAPAKTDSNTSPMRLASMQEKTELEAKNKQLQEDNDKLRQQLDRAEAMAAEASAAAGAAKASAAAEQSSAGGSKGSTEDAGAGAGAGGHDFHMPTKMDNPAASGYPGSRIGMGSLRFCDLGWAGMPRAKMTWEPLTCPHLRNEPRQQDWKDNDPTCKKCLSAKALAEQDRLIKWYDDKDKAKERRARYREWFGEPIPTKPVVITTANGPYLKALNVWWCFAERQGASKAHQLVYAIDDDVSAWAKSAGLRTVSASKDYSFKIEKVASSFKYILFPLLGDLLHAGYSVIFNDADIIWLKDMSTILPQIWPRADLTSQLAARWDAQGTLNSGVMLLRPSFRTTVFVETFMSTYAIFIDVFQGYSDQYMWNHLLRYHKFRTLAFRTLPAGVINLFGRDKVTDKTIAVHWVGGANNGKSKFDRMKSSDLLKKQPGAAECLAIIN